MKKPTPEKKKPSPSRRPIPPLSKRPKVKAKEATPADELTSVRKLLTELVQQQAQLVDLMHHRHHAAVDDGQTLPNYGDHHHSQGAQGPSQPNRMKQFLENNLEMSRLIEENAALKREKLVRTMMASSNLNNSLL